METIELIKIVIALVVGYFILRFIWASIKGIAKLVLAIIVIAVGTYIVKPDILYNIIGEDRVEKVADEVKKESTELISETKENVKSITKNVTK